MSYDVIISVHLVFIIFLFLWIIKVRFPSCTYIDMGFNTEAETAYPPRGIRVAQHFNSFLCTYLISDLLFVFHCFSFSSYKIIKLTSELTLYTFMYIPRVLRTTFESCNGTYSENPRKPSTLVCSHTALLLFRFLNIFVFQIFDFFEISAQWMLIQIALVTHGIYKMLFSFFNAEGRKMY